MKRLVVIFVLFVAGAAWAGEPKDLKLENLELKLQVAELQADLAEVKEELRVVHSWVAGKFSLAKQQATLMARKELAEYKESLKPKPEEGEE